MSDDLLSRHEREEVDEAGCVAKDNDIDKSAGRSLNERISRSLISLPYFLWFLPLSDFPLETSLTRASSSISS